MRRSGTARLAWRRRGSPELSKDELEMTRSGRDVNEIWAKLKADNLPKKDGKVSKTAPIQRDEGNERDGGAETLEIRQSEGAVESFEGYKDPLALSIEMLRKIWKPDTYGRIAPILSLRGTNGLSDRSLQREEILPSHNNDTKQICQVSILE